MSDGVNLDVVVVVVVEEAGLEKRIPNAAPSSMLWAPPWP